MLTKPERILRNEIEWWEENLNIRSTKLDMDIAPYLNVNIHPSQNPWGITFTNLLDTEKSQLCREYYTPTTELRKYCVDCPISLFTGEHQCVKTPYIEFKKQYGKLISVMNRVKNNNPTKKQLKNIEVAELKTFELCFKYFEFLKEVQIDMNK